MVGDELKDFSGLYFRHPFAAFAMLLFMLSLGGIPPTAGFMGKFWLFGAAIEAGYVWLAVIGVLNSAISLYYYVRVVVFMYLKKETTGSEPTASPALAFTLAVAVVGDARARRVSAAAVRAGGGVGADARAWRAWRRRSGSRERSRLSDRRFRRLGEVFHKVRYTSRPLERRTPDAPVMSCATTAEPDLQRSLKALQENVRRAGPAAAASYTLIGAIMLLGGIGYALDALARARRPGFCSAGCCSGIVVGFYELAKTVWRRNEAPVAVDGRGRASAPWLAGRARWLDARTRLEVLLRDARSAGRGRRVVGADGAHVSAEPGAADGGDDGGVRRQDGVLRRSTWR